MLRQTLKRRYIKNFMKNNSSSTLVRNPFAFVFDFFVELGAISRFCFIAIRSLFIPPFRKSITRRQMDTIGVGCLPIVSMTGIFMGLVLALQSIVELRNIGATSYMGRAIGTTVIRELGPVLTSIMVAARSGSAIAAELASMSINEQIDALRAEGSDPIKKLVEPRFLACAFMTPVLTMICSMIAFVGGWLVAVRDIQISSYFYWDCVFEVLTPAFVWGGLLKAFMFGSLIGLISCYCGMRHNMGSSGVGEATTRCVMLCSILILAVDFLLTKIFIVTWW
jgi:phospholipid/cholesterol/gamma-HCH transport system permease protein